MINIKLKCLKLGNLVITTKHNLETADIVTTLEPEQVWELFQRAIKEQ